MLRSPDRSFLGMSFCKAKLKPHLCWCRVTCSVPCAKQSSSQKDLDGKAWDILDVGAQTRVSVHSGRLSSSPVPSQMLVMLLKLQLSLLDAFLRYLDMSLPG